MLKPRYHSFVWFLRILAILLIASNVYLWHYLVTKADSNHHIYFLDVGQGDAVFIRTAADFRILIDGGPDDRVVGLLGQLLPSWDRHIDLVIATHPHADHIAGLSAVLDQYSVDEFWWNGSDYDSDIFKRLSAQIHTLPLAAKIIDRQASLPLPDDNSTLQVVYPTITKIATTDINETSIVTLLQLGNFDLWLSGDSGNPTEAALLAAGVVPDVEVLKLGHHGSNSSSSPAFLDALQPEIGVITVGNNNRYGHPHAEILERLTTRKIRIYRTDLQSTLELTTDGSRYRVAPWRLWP